MRGQDIIFGKYLTGLDSAFVPSPDSAGTRAGQPGKVGAVRRVRLKLAGHPTSVRELARGDFRKACCKLISPATKYYGASFSLNWTQRGPPNDASRSET